MPRIRQYTSETLAQGLPPTRGASAGDFGNAGMSAAGESLTRAADFLQERATQEDVSNVRANMAKARADWTLNLQERLQKAKPGDLSFASTFGSELEDYLEKTRDTVQTKHGEQVFRQMAAEMRGHFVSTAAAGQAGLAGKKAVLDYNVTLDAGRNTLLSDPTQHGAVLKSALEGLSDPNGPFANMPAAEREALAVQTRKQLSLSAVQGLIQNGAAELALRQLKGGTWDKDLDADNKAALVSGAEVAIKGKAVEAERQRAEAERARKEAYRVTQEQMVQKLATNKLTTADILASNLPAVGEGSKEHFLNVLRTRSKEAAEAPIRTVPSVALGLFSRIHSNGSDRITDENAVNAAYLAKQLSYEDMQRLRKEVTEARSPEGERLGAIKKDFFNTVAKPQIAKANPLTGVLMDSTSGEDYWKYQQFVEDRVAEQRKAGKNPYDLFDPSKPDYVGKPETIKMFAKTFGQAVNAATERLRTTGPIRPAGVAPANARKPGESAEAYLKRRNGG